MKSVPAPRHLGASGLRAVRQRYLHVGLLFGGAAGGTLSLGLLAAGWASANRSLHLAEHFANMLGPVGLGLGVTVVLTAVATAWLWAWDRWQLARTLRRVQLLEGEEVTAIAPAYVGSPKPLLMRLQTFGEFLVLTDRRLLRARWGFLGIPYAQSVLLDVGQRGALALRDQCDDLGPLRAEFLRFLGMGAFLTLVPVGNVEATHIVPEVGSCELLVAALRDADRVIEGLPPG